MAVFTTIWRSPRRECILVIGDSTSELCLLQDQTIIRRAVSPSPIVAVRLANAWERC